MFSFRVINGEEVSSETPSPPENLALGCARGKLFTRGRNEMRRKGSRGMWDEEQEEEEEEAE
eukprot:6886772-Pyramimonas_sp.AAC.1